jgi:pantothenate kinase
MSHETRPPNLESLVDRVLDALQARSRVYLLAVVGIPGSGKSTLSQAIANRIPGSVVLPMDGYHVPRARLSDADMKRRGAPHTFDFRQLKADLHDLRQKRAGSFPAFDHAKKDPEPNAIHVTRDNSPILVEGNYLLLQAWGLADLFDFKIFIDCEPQRAMDRVQNRLVECRIVATREEAIQQVQTNDLLNADLILHDGTSSRVDLILRQD